MAGSAAAENAAGGGAARRKRGRGVVGGEMAVKRFVAFFAGVRVDRVVMVGGVHVLAGAARTRARTFTLLGKHPKNCPHLVFNILVDLTDRY